jgi:DNA repair photolyase
MATLLNLPASPVLTPIGRRRSTQTSLSLFPTAARHGDPEPASAASTPPPVPDRSARPAGELVGIARLAASSPCADAKRGTEYFVLPVRSILNHCDSERVPFNWTINPYRGCEFGCRYCYARYTHEFMELDGGDFEKKIYAKKDAGAIVARDLQNRRIQGEHIAIGTATDPYQPAEREFGATRAILERMAERDGMSISITTKSNQVVRDLDLLRKIAERSSIMVNFSISTLRTRLARMLEPRAPRPDLRMEALKKLCEAGIPAGVLAMPLIPGITDGAADLEALAKAASEAGAQWFASNVLFLMPTALKQFMPFVEEKFPRLAKQYREWYVRHGGAPDNDKREMQQRVRDLRTKYHLGSRPEAPASTRVPQSVPQLNLGFSVEDSAGGVGASNSNKFIL